MTLDSVDCPSPGVVDLPTMDERCVCLLCLRCEVFFAICLIIIIPTFFAWDSRDWEGRKLGFESPDHAVPS